jgi:hypothetical protein
MISDMSVGEYASLSILDKDGNKLDKHYVSTCIRAFRKASFSPAGSSVGHWESACPSLTRLLDPQIDSIWALGQTFPPRSTIKLYS